MTAIPPVFGPESGSVASSLNPGGQLGKEEFLSLLVTQLRYQDPLNPTDPTQFTSQLAEFSALEQLTNINSAMDLQSQNSAFLTLAMNTNLAASLVGRSVLAIGEHVYVPDSGDATIVVDVAGIGGSGTLRLFDENGVQVGSQEMGGIGGGRQRIPLDDFGLSEGIYRYELGIVGADGAQVHVTSYAGGVVDGVQFENMGLMLRVGDLLIPLNQLVEVAGANLRD